jgi:PPP family 3-phenylpropionic acid transporter
LGAHSAYDLILSLHLRDLGASSGCVGVAWAVGTLAEVALMFVSRSWLARCGAPRLMLAGAVTAVLRWVLLALVHDPIALTMLQPLHAGSFALVYVAALEFVRRRAEPHVLATAQGVYTAAGASGAALSMFLWAPLYEAARGPTVFAGAAALALVSVGALAGLASLSVPGVSPGERADAPGLEAGS